jgi:deferrochelatase/peroxidase EfeB
MPSTRMWISTEHKSSFGFQDGISNPIITGFDKVIQPGPSPVQPGVIVTGKTGDPGLSIREDWSTEGSFAAFRYLFQDVPGFNDFLKNNPLPEDGNGKPLTPEEGSNFLGARMVGRWKSGAPIDVSPLHDDPILAKDPSRYIYTSSCKQGESEMLIN